MRFYVGLHMPHQAVHFERCMVSVNRLLERKSDFPAREWLLDSGAFTRITTGKGHLPVQEYASQVERWSKCGVLAAAVSQDWMCEQFVLGKTGLTVKDHQKMTVERYDELLVLTRQHAYLMPVLQGYWPDEYLEHLEMYGNRLSEGQWVGVGSVCKRNANVESIEHVLVAIREARPDLRLHGFGVKTTALESSIVRACLYSADSMAWSDAARHAMLDLLNPLREELGYKIKPKQARELLAERGVKLRDAHDHNEARSFVDGIENQQIKKRVYQPKLF